MEPIIKGYLWDITFYPCYNRYRTVKDIFWYDSSDELAFVNRTDGYQILVPEHLIQGTPEDIQWVHDNLAQIRETQQLIVQTDNQGNWTLNLDDKS
jgi:hypothetical protein